MGEEEADVGMSQMGIMGVSNNIINILLFVENSVARSRQQIDGFYFSFFE